MRLSIGSVGRGMSRAKRQRIGCHQHFRKWRVTSRGKCRPYKRNKKQARAPVGMTSSHSESLKGLGNKKRRKRPNTSKSKKKTSRRRRPNTLNEQVFFFKDGANLEQRVLSLLEERGALAHHRRRCGCEAREQQAGLDLTRWLDTRMVLVFGALILVSSALQLWYLPAPKRRRRSPVTSEYTSHPELDGNRRGSSWDIGIEEHRGFMEEDLVKSTPREQHQLGMFGGTGAALPPWKRRVPPADGQDWAGVDYSHKYSGASSASQPANNGANPPAQLQRRGGARCGGLARIRSERSPVPQHRRRPCQRDGRGSSSTTKQQPAAQKPGLLSRSKGDNSASAAGEIGVIHEVRVSHRQLCQCARQSSGGATVAPLRSQVALLSLLLSPLVLAVPLLASKGIVLVKGVDTSQNSTAVSADSVNSITIGGSGAAGGGSAPGVVTVTTSNVNSVTAPSVNTAPSTNANNNVNNDQDNNTGGVTTSVTNTNPG